MGFDKNTNPYYLDYWNCITSVNTKELFSGRFSYNSVDIMSILCEHRQYYDFIMIEANKHYKRLSKKNKKIAKDKTFCLTVKMDIPGNVTDAYIRFGVADNFVYLREFVEKQAIRKNKLDKIKN